MGKIRHILQSHFHNNNWTITKPEDGQQKECYIAQNGGFKVFLKFDVPVAPLRRLGELEVAPGVLTSGILDDRTYVIQEYIAGTYPDWQWFAHHLPLLAKFIKRYHDDEELTAILSGGTKTSYHEHIEADIADLEARFQTLDSSELHKPAIAEAFEMLKVQAQGLQPVKLVPIHADPNTVNILLTRDTLLMVDWDDIQLSDPMHDAGQLLWWYVARRQWDEFFTAYGLQMDEALLTRIHWWAARTSFAIALWHVAHAYDCASFLIDFVAAIHGKSNPHAVFR
ncbi:MAG TPA: phosphotransferase [Ktedonobacteraceae bacterium]|nr:phosphotransferase [Ktedonobacteraceae bacterium]